MILDQAGGVGRLKPDLYFCVKAVCGEGTQTTSTVIGWLGRNIFLFFRFFF